MRLLLKNLSLGWTSYIWLVYLSFFILPPLFYGSAQQILLAFLGVAIFLPFYFLGYRLDGWKVAWSAVPMVALGCVFAPTNQGASTFFIFSAASLARLGSKRRALCALALLILVITIVAWQLQPHPFFWMPAMICSILVGGLCIHQQEIDSANARLRLSQEEVRRLATIAERERIARDLHDLLGHTLSMIVLKSELAAKLADRDVHKAILEIQEVERISRQTLKEVRSAVAGYRAETLDSEVDNARSALKTAGVELDYQGAGMTLAPLQEGVLALALREAVTNVVRHARASHCRIRLEKDTHRVRLSVQDNGQGFAAPEGSGLAGMRERVTGLGGQIERRHGNGTKLIVSLPINMPNGFEPLGVSA